MSTIDYVFRFDPANPSAKSVPADSETARQLLENGNRTFSAWMENCRTGIVGEEQYIVPCNSMISGISQQPGQMPKQRPFAVVLGCSDARVPTEMLFAQGFNDLFVIRVAGNVLGDVCMGSVDFALEALESVRVAVVLGHSGCGAVSGAVDAYLNPQKFWARSLTPMLRVILQRIFVAVRETANVFKEVWGPDASQMPGYREALIEAAICMNAAHSAYALRQEVERNENSKIEVLYGVHNIRNHQVCMPVDPTAPPNHDNVRLAVAPSDPSEFRELAIQMAELLKVPAQQA